MDGSIVQVGEDGLVIVRASALGACIKALVAARMEYAQVPRQTTQQGEGELHEQDVLTRMERNGWTISNRQQRVVLPITHTISVVGHIDALGEKNGFALVDVKSQSKDAWDDFEARGWDSGFFPHYKWQFSAYMHALQLPGLLARKNRNTGEVKYQNIDAPFYSEADIRRRVLEMESWAVRGELPETCDKKMYPCPVYYLHEDEKFEVLDDALIADLARQHEQAKRDEKVAKEKKDAARKALREGLGLRLEDGKVVGETMKVSAHGVKVSFYNQNNPPSTDWPRVYEAMNLTSEQFDVQFKSQKKSERLRITLPKESE